MKCITCGHSLVIGDHRIPLDDWLAKKFLGYVIDRHLSFDLVVDQITTDQIWEIDDLFYSSMDKCFECFFGVCCEQFGWDFALLDLGVPLSQQHHLVGFSQLRGQIDEAWRDFFTRAVVFGYADALHYLIDRNAAQSGDRYLNFVKRCDEISLSSKSAGAILEWLGDRTDSFENIHFQFWEIVRNGYRTAIDLELLDVEGNFDFSGDWELAPNIEFLRKHEITAQSFIDLADTLTSCFEDWYMQTFEDKTFLLQLMIENQISSADIECLRSDEFAPLWLDYQFLEESDDVYLQYEHLYSVFENLRELRLPINSGTFLKYYGLSKEHILFSIDNEIIDSDYFLSARFFQEAPISWLLKSRDLLKAGVQIIDIGVILSRTGGFELLSTRDLEFSVILRLAGLLRYQLELSANDAYGWIEMFEDADVPVLFEWASVNLSPVVAREWKVAGFEPSAAKAWAREVDDPQIALRRIQAGILPPAITDRDL